MRKGMLKKLKPLKATAWMIRAKENDKPEIKEIRGNGSTRRTKQVLVYRYYRFFHAEVEEGILKIGIWQRATLLEKGQETDFTIYIDNRENKWITESQGGWSKAKIFNLPYDREEGEIFGSYNWSSEKDLKTVIEYTGTPAATIPAAIRKWQVSQTGKIKKEYKNDLEKIDEFIESIPPYPAGFNKEWVMKKAFRDRTSILYKPGKNVTEGLCTCCGKWVPIKDKPRHLKETTCSKCKNTATFRSWNRQRAIEEKKCIGIIKR